MSIIKKVFLVFIFLISNNISIKAQNSFIEGFVIKKDGDTLKGKIKTGSQRRMHSICLFKKNDEDQIQEYEPFDIKSYSVNGKYLVSKEVNLDGNQKKVFLEFLINGQADLYFYKEKNSIHYYLQNKSDSLIELKNTVEEINTDKGKFIKNKREYLNTLKTAFIDSPEIQPEIDKIILNHKELMDITEKYHNYVCNDYECVRYNKNTKLNISLGLTAAVIFSKINFNLKSSAYRFLKGENFNYTPSFTTGLTYSQTNMLGFNDNLSFNFHLEYQKTNYKSKNINIIQNSISVPIYISYFFPTGNLRPLISFGFRNSFFINSNAIVSNEKYTSLQNAEYTDRLNDAIGNFRLNGLVRIGAEYKKNNTTYSIYSNYELGNGVIISTRYINNFLSSKSQEIGINFGIKRAI